MIEVFKTDISDRRHAVHVIEVMCDAFPQYTVNVDLDDCDKILRIQSAGAIDAAEVIELLRTIECNATVLEDKILY